MTKLNDEIVDCVVTISEISRVLDYPEGVDKCLFTASMLIEEAGDILASEEPGERASELMVLASKVEALMHVPPA